MKNALRSPSCIVSIAALACLHIAAAAAADRDPRAILLQHYEALGGFERVRAERSVYLAGRIVHDGLEGRFCKWERIPLRFRVEEDYGVIRTAYGDDGRHAWTQDANGRVIVQRDEETLKRRRVRGLLQAFDHMKPESGNFTLRYEGTEAVDGIPCHVILTTNRINDDVFRDYFDTRTLLLQKSVLQQPDMTFHTRYADYRDVNGVLHAFSEETEIRPMGKRISVAVDVFDTRFCPDPARFAVPAEAAADFRFTAADRSAEITVELAENLIFMPVTIGGDTRLWVLDSAASMSVIDRDYALKLGLAVHPGIQGSGLDGTFRLDFAVLPEYGVPGVRFDSQKIFCRHGLAARFYEPEAVGILGFDFLSRFVSRIDYANRSLSLQDPQTFVYDGSGTVVDAPLKGKVFVLPMTVEGRYAGKWALDLGSYNVSFHFPFARRQGLLQRPGVDRVSADLSGAYVERAAAFGFAELAGFRIENVLIGIPQREGRGANAAQELIGNLGNSLLRRFVVVLDYQRQQVILEKGKDFERFFSRDGSGLVVGRSENGLPMVSYVAAGTPAELAGFSAGDLIVGIDGVDDDVVSRVVGVRDLLRRPPGTRYRIEVLRDGRTLRFGLTLAALY